LRHQRIKLSEIDRLNDVQVKSCIQGAAFIFFLTPALSKI
jgi:hypothetical protein